MELTIAIKRRDTLSLRSSCGFLEREGSCPMIHLERTAVKREAMTMTARIPDQRRS